jgi:hypothetical protein
MQLIALYHKFSSHRIAHKVLVFQIRDVTIRVSARAMREIRNRMRVLQNIVSPGGFQT